MPSPSPGRRRARPALEPLEDRLMPTVFAVTSTQDNSLPYYQQEIARHYYSLVILSFSQ